MTTLHSISSSSSAAGSTMEDTSHHHRSSKKNNHHRSRRRHPTTTGDSDVEFDEAEGGDPAAWATMNKSFRQVQSVLDRNRLLIQQVNENQQSRMPDNMVKNVSLIQELNGNIEKVVNLYSDLNSNFTNVCHQQQRFSNNNNNGRDK